MHPSLKTLKTSLQKTFRTSKRILSFEDYLTQILLPQPEKALRDSAKYFLDMMDSFGKEPISHPPSQEPDTFLYHFNLFDLPIDRLTKRLIGHEKVQTQIYQTVRSFVAQKKNTQLILLHGPNGSAKTTIIQALMQGLERYSHTEEGRQFHISWVFPKESLTKGKIGLSPQEPSTRSSQDSYAYLAPSHLALKLTCELRDHPLLLIPLNQRKAFLETFLGKDKAQNLWNTLPELFTHGELCERCQMVFDSLFQTYQGDLLEVLKHIQVERFYYKRKNKQALVTIEPQLHVDAQFQQWTIDRRLSDLPIALQTLHLFHLSGSLIDGNRGMIEFSDLLKRPIDSFKYLLHACETGSLTVGQSKLQLDTLFFGTTNDLHLDAFKEYPDFPSFKARLRLIRVPYLLNYKQEADIYKLFLPEIPTQKAPTPHIEITLALWSLLTRLKKPKKEHYPSSIAPLIDTLSPIEKAMLYTHQSLPDRLLAEQRKQLKSSLAFVFSEWASDPFYEGRQGISVREIKTLLFEAAQDPSFPVFSPLSIFHYLKKFIQKKEEYPFLKTQVEGSYYDFGSYVDQVENFYLDIIDKEVKACLDLYDSNQWEQYMKNYILHISLLLKNEKHKNPITGVMEPPEQSLIASFEKKVQAPSEPQLLDKFRRQILSQVGAWALDHPHQSVRYDQIFPQYWKKLEQAFYQTQKPKLSQMHDALLFYNQKKAWKEDSSEGAKLAKKTLKGLQEKYNYSLSGALQVVTFLLKKRYNA